MDITLNPSSRMESISSAPCIHGSERPQLYSELALCSQDAIRLVKLEPSLGTGDVRVRLECAHLGSSTYYYAVSYAWRKPFGNPELDVDDEDSFIVCNGESVPVTRNLFHCLRQLQRSRHAGKLFWIDALSINQNDVDERSEQVAKMAYIYNGAMEVLVWLGKADSHSGPALNIIETLSELEPRRLWELKPTSISSGAERLDLPASLRRTQDWESLAYFFCRSWFKRAWTVQEILCAQSVIVLCGDREISWDALRAVSGYLSTSAWGTVFRHEFSRIPGKPRPNHGGPAKLEAIRRDARNNPETVVIRSLIRMREYDCELSKDRVFCLAGLEAHFTHMSNPCVQVEYRQAGQEVFVRTAVNVLASTDELMPLYYAEGQDYRHLEGLPSWAPDWTVTDVIGLGITGYKRFQAAGTLQRSLYIHENQQDLCKSSLELEALEFDTITTCGEAKRDVLNGELCRNWLSIAHTLNSPYWRSEGNESIMDALWRSLITNTAAQVHEGGERPSTEMRVPFKHWLVRSLYRADPSIIGQLSPEAIHMLREWGVDLDASGIDDAKANDFLAAFHHTLCLRLFRTRMGLLGVGTTSLKMGDTVWIVPGSRVPLIFREENKRTVVNGMKRGVELVGACYLHGIMYGEALAGMRLHMESLLVR